MNGICSECLIRRNRDKYPAWAGEKKAEEYRSRMVRIVEDSAEDASGPEVIAQIRQLRREMFAEEAEDFGKTKRYFNALMLSKEKKIEERILAAPDPLLMALQLAMTGNFIDFAAMETVDEGRLAAMLKKAGDIRFAEDVLSGLREELYAASTLVLLTDNCGEIVLDKLLIRQIRREHPSLAVKVIVRGFPVVNDATMEDALQVGLDGVATVMGSGSGINGTVLKELSDEARKTLTEADLVIAKGQGNYETLNGCGLPVYYLFMCKCAFFVDRFRVPLYDGVLTRESF